MPHADSVRTPSLLVFVKLRDPSSSYAKLRQGMDKFLREYINYLGGVIKAEYGWRLVSDFFVLGHASLVLLVDLMSLAEAPKAVRVISDHYVAYKKKSKVKVGAPFVHSYPVIGIYSKEILDQNCVIPALVFVRSSSSSRRTCKIVKDSPLLRYHVGGVFAGLGTYNSVVYVRCPTLNMIRDVVQALRSGLGGFWETQTIIGVPRVETKDIEIRNSRHRSDFVLSLRCSGHVNKQILSDMIRTARKFPRLFTRSGDGHDVPRICLIQGTMDVDIVFRSSTVSEAFQLALAMRRINRITDSTTTARLGM